MKFQERDGEILQSIYEHEGVMAKRHLKSLFWSGCSWRAMEKRLAKLHHTGYIDWPDREQYRTKPIPEPICWLGWMGILWIAGSSNIVVEPMKTINESRLRNLQNILRKQGIRWVREPRWNLLAHDLKVIDFLLNIREAILELPDLSLERWMMDSAFRSNTDVVKYKWERKQFKKGVCPDGYLEIVDESRKMKGLPYKARFLLELDMATHDNNSFGRDKVLPGVAYIKSRAYQARFETNSGHWLVITTGERRMDHLIKMAEKLAGNEADLFYFTTHDRIRPEMILGGAIWNRGNETKPCQLLVET